MTEAPDFLQRADKGQKDVEIIAKRVLEKYGRGNLLVIIIDTANAVTQGANTNSSEDMGTLIGNCKYLHRVTGAMIVLVDHSPLSTKDRISGWAGKKGACDAQIQVERDGDVRTWHIAKLKNGPDDKVKHGFRLDVVNLREVDDTSCIVEHLGTAPLAPKASGDYESTIVTIVGERKRVGIKELVLLVKKAIPYDGQGRDQREKAIKKAVDRLIEKKVLARVRGTNDVHLIVTEDFES